MCTSPLYYIIAINIRTYMYSYDVMDWYVHVELHADRQTDRQTVTQRFGKYVHLVYERVLNDMTI